MPLWNGYKFDTMLDGLDRHIEVYTGKTVDQLKNQYCVANDDKWLALKIEVFSVQIKFIWLFSCIYCNLKWLIRIKIISKSWLWLKLLQKSFNRWFIDLSHYYDSFNWCIENGCLELCCTIYLRRRNYKIAKILTSFSCKFYLL